jgi:hypothetical protein
MLHLEKRLIIVVPVSFTAAAYIGYKVWDRMQLINLNSCPANKL